MSLKEKLFIHEMKRLRNIDCARIGQQVEIEGHIGTIVGMNDSANLDVVFANRLKFGSKKHNCHPTWQIRYFDTQGDVVADYRASERVEE